MSKTGMPCTEPGCLEDAAYKYVWPWGEEGSCCARHRVVVQQRAYQLEREVSFTILDPDRPTPITRDERTLLIAQKMSAEAETADSKQRAAALYTSNTKLAEEVRRLRARESVLEAEIAAQKDRAEQALEERDKAVADLADVQAEAERLGMLAATERGDNAPGLPG